MRVLGYLTLKDLAYDWRRSLLTVFSLAFIVISYLLLTALSHAYLTFGKQSQVNNNLMIIDANALDPMDSTLDATVLQTAQQLAPGQIQDAFPVLFRHMNIEGHVIQVRAVALEEMQNAMGLTLLQGGWPDGPHQILVSEGALLINSWKIGSKVNIYGTDFEVKGIVRAGGSKFASIWMTYAEGQLLFGDQRGFQIGYLQLKPQANLESVQARLQADPGFTSKYAVYLESTLSDRLNQINHSLLTLSQIQVVISLLAITFGSYNTTSLSLAERGHEIILLRILGFTQNKLQALLLARTLPLAGAAYLLGWLASEALIRLQEAHATISIYAAPLVLTLAPGADLVGLFLVGVFSLFGVWLTSRRLSYLNLSSPAA